MPGFSVCVLGLLLEFLLDASQFVARFLEVLLVDLELGLMIFAVCIDHLMEYFHDGCKGRFAGVGILQLKNKLHQLSNLLAALLETLVNDAQVLSIILRVNKL
jgi:hypothetical protein